MSKLNSYLGIMIIIPMLNGDLLVSLGVHVYCSNKNAL
jgi:hypothetical protein